jgi:WD40 repeat protein
LRGPTGSILGVIITRVGDADVIATANSDESVWVWDAISGEPRHRFLGHMGIATTLAVTQVAGRTVLASGSADMTVRLWDPRERGITSGA